MVCTTAASLAGNTRRLTDESATGVQAQRRQKSRVCRKHRKPTIQSQTGLDLWIGPNPNPDPSFCFNVYVELVFISFLCKSLDKKAEQQRCDGTLCWDWRCQKHLCAAAAVKLLQPGCDSFIKESSTPIVLRVYRTPEPKNQSEQVVLCWDTIWHTLPVV